LLSCSAQDLAGATSSASWTASWVWIEIGFENGGFSHQTGMFIRKMMINHWIFSGTLFSGKPMSRNLCQMFGLT
jgi:hypothetical protein